MLHRRSLLRSLPITLAGAWCAGMDRLTLARPVAPRAKRVVMIFNSGAPSHHDLFDPKPDAPDTIRGPFKAISTRIPGVRFTELIPELASRADKLSLIRTLHHTHTQHNSGMHWSIVGRPYRLDSTLINPGPQDHPSLGTLVGWLTRREEPTRLFPPYVITPHPHCDSFAYITPGQFGGCLGRDNDPLVVAADPAARDFRMPSLEPAPELTSERLRGRNDLLGGLSGPHPMLDALRRRAAAELGGPHEQGVVQEPALLQVCSDFGVSVPQAKRGLLNVGPSRQRDLQRYRAEAGTLMSEVRSHFHWYYEEGVHVMVTEGRGRRQHPRAPYAGQQKTGGAIAAPPVVLSCG